MKKFKFDFFYALKASYPAMVLLAALAAWVTMKYNSPRSLFSIFQPTPAQHESVIIETTVIDVNEPVFLN